MRMEMVQSILRISAHSEHYQSTVPHLERLFSPKEAKTNGVIGVGVIHWRYL